MSQRLRRLTLAVAMAAGAILSVARAGPLAAQAGAPSANVMEVLQRGAQAMHEGKPALAEERFKEAIALAPQMPDAYLGLGMSQLRQGKLEPAEQALARAVELKPDTQGAHLFLGIAQYQSNKLDVAIASIQQEVELQPTNTEALTWLGIAELGAGHPDLATAPLDRAATLNPKDPNILDYRGRAHTMVAQQCFQKLYDLDPGSWHVHRALGEMFSAARQPEQAIGEYTAALKEQPNNPDLYEALGDEYQHVSRSGDAIKSYEQELKLNPQSAIALYNLGKLHVQGGDPETGIPLLQQALQAHANPAPAYYYLGLGLANAERYQQAAESLEASLANHPSDHVRQSDEYALVRVYQKLNRANDAQHALEEFKKLKAASGTPATSIDAP